MSTERMLRQRTPEPVQRADARRPEPPAAPDLTPREVARLQRTAGNHVVARLLSGRLRQAPAVAVQRLKQGDFAYLASFGLDVESWEAFEAAVKKLDHYGLTLALRMLEMKDPGDIDVIQAKLIIERQRYTLRPPPRSGILDSLFGPDDVRTPRRRPPQQLNLGPEGQPSIVIHTGLKEETTISSASDLLVYLVSHPTKQADTPKDFADPAKLTVVLQRLGKRRHKITWATVWRVLREVVDPDPDLESGDESNDDNGPEWPKGEWAKPNKKQLGAQDWDEQDVPMEFRREMSKQEYDERCDALASSLSDHTLVGVHATTMENLGPLMAHGVAVERIDSGHGVGKGRGFYIVPTARGVVDVAAGEKSAKGWDPFVVAVYLPDDCECVDAGPRDNVETMEKKTAGRRCYFKFGRDEAVIPVGLYPLIRLVRDPADITMADPTLPAYSTTKSAVSFVQLL